MHVFLLGLEYGHKIYESFSSSLSSLTYVLIRSFTHYSGPIGDTHLHFTVLIYMLLLQLPLILLYDKKL